MSDGPDGAVEPEHARWPGRVAVGITRSDPPQVFVAESDAVLGRVLALRLVAQADPARLQPEELREVRTALLEERWGDAVTAWMAASGEVVDAYPDETLWTARRLSEELAALEIRTTQIFDESR